MLDDIPAIDPPLPYPVDDEETDRITLKFAAQFAGDSLDTSTDGLRIDRYINAEVRARGGMGRVFVAYDPGLDRTVALKALPVGLLPHEPGADTPRREGIALAHIDHPNVVKVLELVEHRGLACLVLEHVDGPHLGDWLKAPRDFRDILNKFLQAGEGLAAVHRAGLVHRDFKPSNAVVGPGGIVKLIDFGLAFRPATRHPDDADERPGTPRYMAPEQIDGREVDARSDQFSFCVALYEALFRAHPYLTKSDDQNTNPFDADAEQASRATIFDQILDGTPRRPERTPPGLPSTVATALLRGLSPRPDNRHLSMEALLAELRRDSDRTRRRVLFTFAGLLAFAVGLYTALHTEPCPPLLHEKDRIWRKLDKQVQTKLAPFGSVPFAEFERAVGELATANSALCESRYRGFHQETDFAREACLSTQEFLLNKYLQQIARGDKTHVAELLKRLKNIPSAKACEDVVRLRFSCAENFFSALARADSISATLAGDSDRALARAKDALQESENSGASGALAQSHILLGRLAYERGERDRAVHHFALAVDLAERNACFGEAAQAYQWFAKLAAFDEEIPLSLAAIYSKYHRYRVSDEDRMAQAVILNNLSLLAERRLGDLPRAEELLRKAIKLREDDSDYSSDQADSYLNLANVLFAKGQRIEAFTALDDADERRRAAVGALHPDYAKHLRNRGSFEFQVGNYPRALDLLKRALARYGTGVGNDAPVLGEIHLWLSLVYDRLGERENALRSAEVASRLFPDKTRRAESIEAQAQMQIASGNFETALSLLDSAQNLLKILDIPPERRGTVDFKRGEALNGLERHQEAEDYARLALGRFSEARLPASHEYWAYGALILGEALNGQARWREAAAPFTRAIAIWEKRNDNPELLAYAKLGLAESLCRLPDRSAEAREVAQQIFFAEPVIDHDDAWHARKQQLVQICRLQ